MAWILAASFWGLLFCMGAIFALVWRRGPPGSRLAWLGNLIILLLIGILGMALFIYPVR